MTAFLEYSDRDHKYYADGRERMSVTQILNKAGLVSEYAKDAEAQWRGSEVHRLCAADDQHRLDEGMEIDLRTVDKRLRGYIRAWRRYLSESHFVPKEIELRVDDHLNGYAGRLDRTGFFKSPDLPTLLQDVIIDLKTSKTGSVSDYVRYQLVAYAHAYERGRVFNRIAVALKPDGSYSCKVWPTHLFQADLAGWFQILNTVRKENNPK